MASVETTTIRVRRTTHQRLQKEAELAGKSVTQVLEEAADALEERRMIEGAVRAWERYAEIPAEIASQENALEEALFDEWPSSPSPDGD
jgi:uncharacterized protein (DUF1778 family)